ncbi:hypothetical protein [Pontibacter sp. H249]|uniref:hypothetical protein n=1 Tax=Pontibacter sp. H249 TaxID=3133420 RepID=UPI0030BC0C9E
MGTTQSISSRVKYDPNWRGLNTAISSVAKAVEELIALDTEDSSDHTDTEVDVNLDTKIKKAEKRKEKNLGKLFKRFAELENGSGRSSTGKSKNKVWGRSGKKASIRLGYVLSSIATSGLDKTLDAIGLSHLKGKDLKTIVGGLLDYCATNADTMDEVAARAASGLIIEEFLKNNWGPITTGTPPQAAGLSDNELSKCLVNFWSYYIFENLFERFNESILQKFTNNPTVKANTAHEIKNFIINSLNALNYKVEFIKIDWKGSEGRAIIDRLYISIINIFR